MDLSWVEISKKSLVANIKTFRSLIGREVCLGVAVKSNAYGHGLIESAKTFIKAGADYLLVNAIYEAEALRKAGINSPILIIGYTAISDLPGALTLKCDLVVYNIETIKALGKLGKPVNVHLKIETGNNRQGVLPADLPKVIKTLKKYKNLNMTGVSTHFANIEDRVNHKYALYQLREFRKSIKILEENGLAPRFRHCANSAAAIVLPEAHFNFVRVGIGAYGLWPSKKTRQAADHAGIDISLSPALRWKTRVVQIKEVDKGAMIGYGCTYKMSKKGLIAVLPVGYYDGFFRHRSSKGYVLIHGKKAPVIGRICMNMTMADISAIPNVKPEDEVTIIGPNLPAETVADWSGTINYEVTTRINDRIPRIFVVE